MRKYLFRPTNNITMYEIIEVMKAVEFEVPETTYEKLTVSQRHFQEKEMDTLEEPKKNPLKPEAKASMVTEPVQESKPKDSGYSQKKSKNINFGSRV